MKKKSIALLATIALVASLTACGSKTEEAANTNVSEPVVETTVSEESQAVEPTEAPVQESQVVESTEAPAEEAPVEEVALYEVSELVFPDGVTPTYTTADDFYNFLNNGAYENTSVMVPYYTITNTSDSAYYIIVKDLEQYEDHYFEPGESIVLPGRLYRDRNNNDVPKWCTTLDSSFDNGGIKTENEAKPERNVIQEMVTLTFDESKVDKTISDTALMTDIAQDNITVNYVIYYDADGNVITSGTNATLRDKIFTYTYDYEKREPLVWASADVYYSYEVAAE